MKFLGYERGRLTLVSYNYSFEVEGVTRGEGVFTEQSFMIKVPNSNRYLRSTPSGPKGISRITIEKFDPRNEKQFYFHLRRMEASNLSLKGIRQIDKIL